MKKNFRFLCMALFAIVVSVSIAACSSDDDDNSGNNSIVGTWVHECDGSCMDDDDAHSVTMTFKSDGTVSFKEVYPDEPSYNWTDKGQYRIADNDGEGTLKILWEDEYNEGWDDAWTVTYKIMDGGKSLWISENGGIIYKRK